MLPGIVANMPHQSSRELFTLHPLTNIRTATRIYSIIRARLDDVTNWRFMVAKVGVCALVIRLKDLAS